MLSIVFFTKVLKKLKKILFSIFMSVCLLSVKYCFFTKVLKKLKKNIIFNFHESLSFKC